jgi:exopolyphosphatase / guanosine-5'-triphosphate,3'-diphosphate pyrophosphatase
MMKVASIDIGTNTILLLIANVGEGKLEPLLEKETVVRLGEGLQKNGVLSSAAMDRGYLALGEYLQLCESRGVQKIFAAGTSALREAKNSDEFRAGVKGRLGLSIEVISGEEEARLSYLAVARDLGKTAQPILVIDVGGGSTELVLGKGDRVAQWVSLPIGLVRFTEQFLVSDPVREEEWEGMRDRIRQVLLKVPEPGEPFLMVSVGGTGTTLASVEQGLPRFAVEKIHHFVMTREAFQNQLLLYRSKSVDQRKRIPGLPPNRADVILAGGTILDQAMDRLSASSVLISCHGVRYGLLYQRLSLGKPVFSDPG